MGKRAGLSGDAVPPRDCTAAARARERSASSGGRAHWSGEQLERVGSPHREQRFGLDGVKGIGNGVERADALHRGATLEGQRRCADATAAGWLALHVVHVDPRAADLALEADEGVDAAKLGCC